MNPRKSIIGIGNALMDIVVKLPNDDFLLQNNLPKGSMSHVDAAASQKINEKTQQFERVLVPGGSVANTVHGLASLGVETAFVGKVGNDELGQFYQNELAKIGAKPTLFKTTTPTGVAMGLITPDSERTFATYLGAAIELSENEITIDLFRGYDIAYIEGYLVQNHSLVRKAAEMARKAGLTIALDLASYNVVADNLDFLKEMVTNYVDIIFANEDEAKAFTGLNPIDAVHELANLCDIAVVKMGKDGSVIKRGDEIVHIGVTGTVCVDSTGAGDIYAAGFLYGYSSNLEMEMCGKIAATTAGSVIAIYGARLNQEAWIEINKKIGRLGV